MIQPDSQRVRKSITRFRRFTLVSVVIIVLINFFMVSRITHVLDHGSATKINDSARMRLHSQSIRSAAYEIDTTVRNANWSQLQPLYDSLSTTTNSLKHAYEQLFTGSSPKTLFPDATTQELDQVASIAVPYQRLSSASDELQMLTKNAIRRAPYLDAQTADRISATMREIKDAQTLFLPRMETIVDLFEGRSRGEIKASITQARAGLIVLTLMLIAMVLFIIEPTILIVRKQLQDLDRATRHAQRADSVRWRLLTNMGHEFRTPMNAILGFTALLNEDSLSDSERNRLSRSINDSAQHLATLIETMLDMSAIESGQLNINNTTCTLGDILSPAIQRATTKALAKGLTLSPTLDPSCNLRISTDTKRLVQIVEKLLDNAIKFTNNGSISIESRVDNHPLAPTITVAITDTGIGIEQDELADIFDAFHQSQSTLTRKYGGSGLGLSFARDVAKAMQGNITVESAPGQGARFTLTVTTPPLPVESSPPNTQAQSDADTAALKGARILIVDDAKDNRVLLQHFFKSTQAQTEFAHNGEQAIQCVMQAQQQAQPFDLILMDMQMPVLDGYAATKQLRQSGINTPTIAITAHALDGDRERCIQAGCDDYLTKPINKASLINACAILMSQPHAAPIQTAA